MDQQGNRASLQIWWDDAALDLLDNTDRFTRTAVTRDIRKAIRDEFNGAASDKFILFDSARNGYVTPVDDDRRAAVWYHHKDKNVAEISAIFTGVRNLKRYSGDRLHEYIQRIVSAESNGRILLP